MINSWKFKRYEQWRCYSGVFTSVPPPLNPPGGGGGTDVNSGVQKNIHVKKDLSKNIYIFVNKLNIINFNIFNMFKLIFTCEFCATLLQNYLINVSYQLFSIFFYLFSTLIVSLKIDDWFAYFILWWFILILFFSFLLK